jgi:hypothetical protein
MKAGLCSPMPDAGQYAVIRLAPNRFRCFAWFGTPPARLSRFDIVRRAGGPTAAHVSLSGIGPLRLVSEITGSSSDMVRDVGDDVVRYPPVDAETLRATPWSSAGNHGI